MLKRLFYRIEGKINIHDIVEKFGFPRPQGATGKVLYIKTRQGTRVSDSSLQGKPVSQEIVFCLILGKQSSFKIYLNNS